MSSRSMSTWWISCTISWGDTCQGEGPDHPGEDISLSPAQSSQFPTFWLLNCRPCIYIYMPIYTCVCECRVYTRLHDKSLAPVPSGLNYFCRPRVSPEQSSRRCKNGGKKTILPSPLPNAQVPRVNGFPAPEGVLWGPSTWVQKT